MKEYREEMLKELDQRMSYLREFEINKTTLTDSLSFLKAYSGSIMLTLRLYDKDNILVMNNTTTFCHFKEDGLNPSLYSIESGGSLNYFISKDSADNYILTGLDLKLLHLVYTYKLQ